MYQIPEIEKSLKAVELLQRKRDAGEPVRVWLPRRCSHACALPQVNPAAAQATFDFSLSEQAYAKATAKDIKTVNLWLGAQVMLEYGLDDAKALLVGRLSSAPARPACCTAFVRTASLQMQQQEAQQEQMCCCCCPQEDNVSKAREQLQQLNSELDTLKDFITTSQARGVQTPWDGVQACRLVAGKTCAATQVNQARLYNHDVTRRRSQKSNE